MRTGWLGFGRQRKRSGAVAPDSGVAGLRGWLTSAAIIASTAALLGTSPEPEFRTSYEFERLGVDGGFVELTVDQPSATFFVTISADQLGPDGVLTTESARALLSGDLTVSELDEGEQTPFLSVAVSSPDEGSVVEKLILDHYDGAQPLAFMGDCETPTTGVACTARFQVDVARRDQGKSGGKMRFDWSFDVRSSASVSAAKNSVVGPLDPPWTVQVSQP